MLLAIDVGNTQTVFGLWDGHEWIESWRRATDAEATEDELAAWLEGLFTIRGLRFGADEIVYASVVPAMDAAIHLLGDKWFKVKVEQISAAMDLGIPIGYEPATAVGADRIANALGALDRFKPPIVVVDFGTATTFDSIDRDGSYAGGAILPGPIVSAQALVGRTAKLPQVELKAPPSALGRNTTHALQSGLVLGYASAIEGLAKAISAELGENTTVIATGGLGRLFIGLCPTISSYEPNLTLDGLRIAHERLRRAV